MTQLIRPFWWHLNLRKEREINRVRALILSVDRMNENLAHNSEIEYMLYLICFVQSKFLYILM